MWVCAGSSKYGTRMGFCQRKRKLARGEIGTRINDASNAALAGHRNYGFAVGIEAGSINVGMTIDEQPEFPFCGSYWPGTRKGQSISKKRPSRFVILSRALSSCTQRRICVRREILRSG